MGHLPNRVVNSRLLCGIVATFLLPLLAQGQSALCQTDSGTQICTQAGSCMGTVVGVFGDEYCGRGPNLKSGPRQPADGPVFFWNGKQFQSVNAALKQIVAGSKNDVWGLNSGTDNIFQWDGSGFKNVPGALVTVAVGTDGAVWGINSQHNIFSFSKKDGAFHQVAGGLTTIAVGSKDHVWGLNEGAENIFRWDGSAFRKVSGQLSAIAVGTDGTVWGINSAQNVFYYSKADNAFHKVNAGLSSIAVGSSENVWGLNDGVDNIFRWNGSGFINVPGALTKISASGDGAVWGINRQQDVFRYTGGPNGHFEKISNSALNSVSTASQGVVWGIAPPPKKK